MEKLFVKSFVKLSSVLEKPFYASDIELNGGNINALKMYNLIQETGRFKEYAIPHPYYDHLLIKCKVKEWVVKEDVYYRTIPRIKKEIKEMEKIVILCKIMGF